MISTTTTDELLKVDDLRVEFRFREGIFGGGTIRAVDGVSFTLHRGETLGLVGESGCGKSTTARAILRIERIASGEIVLDGVPLHRLSASELRKQRRKLQMIFQNPGGSLNPRHRVGAIIAEPLVIQSIGTDEERDGRVAELLELVGLPADLAARYPHELSGGQQQRVAIARALSSNPSLIVCDEPVSALDVSIQAQIVNLLADLRSELGLAYLFIAHDLAVVRYIADNVAVMYLGKIVELGSSEDVYNTPLHPYTKALISAIPIPDAEVERTRDRILLEGDIPSPAHPPSGCRFRTRCPWAQQRCADEEPALRTASGDHLVACHFFEDISEELRREGVDIVPE
jgi:oligopeptide/dipeptide ABC transporter ATP-binding protein